MELAGREETPRTEWMMLAVIAAATAVVHIATNGKYGFHRDELQVIDDARHLAWGYVTYPPVTPLIEHVALALFGTSLIGLRMFSVIAQALAIVVTGMMACELGGGRLAQAVAALAVVISPLPMFEATEFQYSTFDYLWWVLIAYCAIRLLKSEDARWWLGIGAAIGVGMMTKYTMGFLVAGVVVGVLLTPARRYLKSPWLWAGAALSVLMFLPDLLWEAHRHFISLEFLQHIHTRDVGEGRANGFIWGQFWVCANLVVAPIWLAGLVSYFAGRDAKRYRMLGWMYVVPLAMLFFMKGRDYYLAGAYPMLFAAGSVTGERWVAGLRAGWARTVKAATFALMALGGVGMAAIVIPVMPIDSPHNIAIKNNGDLREEIGWREMVAEVARIRDTLTPEQRAHLGILATNYGEMGAVNLYGPEYGLPQAISGVNSAWYRRYGNPPPETLIVLGLSEHGIERHFGTCQPVGHNGNRYGIKNEESEDHPIIYLCGAPIGGWPAFWSDFRYFG
ncbi:MAG TPA: glycosyltransferase family 39 protein [Candidatus Limnocylindrales bacterium]|nr:glycosyltransferase family 39 protein [Candidatus Limnocylindrales bacterium]